MRLNFLKMFFFVIGIFYSNFCYSVLNKSNSSPSYFSAEMTSLSEFEQGYLIGLRSSFSTILTQTPYNGSLFLRSNSLLKGDLINNLVIRLGAQIQKDQTYESLKGLQSFLLDLENKMFTSTYKQGSISNLNSLAYTQNQQRQILEVLNKDMVSAENIHSIESSFQTDALAAGYFYAIKRFLKILAEVTQLTLYYPDIKNNKLDIQSDVYTDFFYSRRDLFNAFAKTHIKDASLFKSSWIQSQLKIQSAKISNSSPQAVGFKQEGNILFPVVSPSELRLLLEKQDKAFLAAMNDLGSLYSEILDRNKDSRLIKCAQVFSY